VKELNIIEQQEIVKLLRSMPEGSEKEQTYEMAMMYCETMGLTWEGVIVV
jgi:hypothetical protein